jgi:sugar O-acyltransferase (sialic acid O-acetyltransferase NeuD family)
MMDLLIVGAGGAGREIYWWIEAGGRQEWQVAGFLDRNPAALDGKKIGPRVLGNPEDWESNGNQVFVCAIGDTKVREQVCELLEKRGASFAAIVHPSAVVTPGSVVAPGCILSPHTLLGPDATLDRHVYVNVGASVHHDAQVGKWSFIGPHASVLGGVGIGHGVFIGANACILPGVAVGDFATVGAGAVVTKDVKPAATVYGVPAKEKPSTRINR